MSLEQQSGNDGKEEEDRRLLAEVDPFADAAAVRAVELVCGVDMEQGEDREEKEIEEKEGDPNGPASEGSATI